MGVVVRNHKAREDSGRNKNSFEKEKPLVALE